MSKVKGKRDPGNRGLYRRLVGSEDLISFSVTVKETDLLVLAESDLSAKVRDLVLTHRHRLERWIDLHPGFLGARSPLPLDEGAPPIVRLMLRSALAAGVGPMAAVAGAVAEAVGRELSAESGELIIENGGDLWLAGARERTVAVFTGERKLQSRLGVKVVPGDGIGVCTSSGTLGHSLSLGEASTATIVAPSAALADAAATATGNVVRGRDGVEKGLELARGIEGVAGAVIVHAGRVGAWGEVELAALSPARGDR